MSKNAIIIGAGPAGLTAAYELLKKSDIIPVILEESPYIGGISRTAVFGERRMDLGGHRFFSKNQRVMDLWLELMPLQGAPALDEKILGTEGEYAENGPDPEAEDRVMLRRRRVSRIYYLRNFFDYPISLKFATFKNMGLLRTMKAGFGYIGSAIHKREENSLEDFYINRFGRPLYEMFFEDYTEKLWGVHPSKIAPDWGAQRVKGLSLMKTVLAALTKPFKKQGSQTETSLIESFYYPKKGPGQLYEIMAAEIQKMGGRILMNARVIGLETDNGRVQAVTYEDTQTGERVSMPCDEVFSTMPVKDLVAAMNPKAPETVREVASALPYRDFITVGLLVDKLAIQNKTRMKTLGNIVPDCWIYVQERDVKLGRLQIFNNWSPYMLPDPENQVWMGLEYFCSEGDELWNKSSEEFVAFAKEELLRIGVISSPDAVKDATHLRVKKAYPAYFGSYARFDEVRSYTDGFENLWLLGRNGQHRYNNMDHSMLTAMEAVDTILSGKRDKNVVWNVNTEEVYHETDEKKEEKRES